MPYTMPNGSSLKGRRRKRKVRFLYSVSLLFMMVLINGWISILVNGNIVDSIEEKLELQLSSIATRQGTVQPTLGTRASVDTKGSAQESKDVTNITFYKLKTNIQFDTSHNIHPALYSEANMNKSPFKSSNQSRISANSVLHRESSILGFPTFDIFSRNLTSGQMTTGPLDIVRQQNENYTRYMPLTENPAANLATANLDNSVDLDISDIDDHIYLEENLEFKRLLENGDELNCIQERMWREKHKSNLTHADRNRVYDLYYKNIENQGKIDCNKVLKNDEGAIVSARQYMSVHSKKGVRTDSYIKMKDCAKFKRKRGYIENPLSDSERNFPLAFGIIMYRDVEQTERLLRAIYRPHNFYCIHVDRKSYKGIRLAVENIAKCFHNVFIATKLENVTWGEFTVLQADLNCMEELLKYKSWKYYINLTGQEYPLKTNREIVEILQAMDGANIVDGTWVRANEKHFYRWTSAGNRPPHGIRPIKGSVHVLVNRHFVDFCVHDTRALDFLAWLQRTQIPDETYFPSLNHNPHLGIKGSFLGEPEAYPLKPAFMRYKSWEFGHSSSSRPCSGKYVRHICILGVGDLNSAYNDIALFVNKFHLDFEYLALDCLEEVLHKKTWQQYLEDTPIDVSYYKNLDYVKYKLT